MTLPIPFLHLWRPMKWGASTNLDCRECRICGRFEIWVLTGFHKTDRETVPNVRPA